MGPSLIACDREQSFLMPPDVRDWLPENHLAWFVLVAVEEMDLGPFYAAYRVDGKSRPAYEPAMMVALLLYAYARGIRSSRVIERACIEGVAFRVIAAQQRPDHATIARFVGRHETALAGFVRGGAAALRALGPGQRRGHRDRRKPRCTPTRVATRTSTTSSWRARSSKKPRRSTPPRMSSTAIGAATSCPRSGRPSQGRRGWLREAKRRLEAERDRSPQPVPRSRPKRVKEAKRRLEAELWTECRANEAYERYRTGRMTDGRRFSRPPDPYTPPSAPQGRINTTDPDSRVVKGAARLHPGLQCAGRHQRAANRHRGRGHDRGARLRAPGADA